MRIKLLKFIAKFIGFDGDIYPPFEPSCSGPGLTGDFQSNQSLHGSNPSRPMGWGKTSSPPLQPETKS